MRRLSHRNSERLAWLLGWWMVQPGLLTQTNSRIPALNFSALWFPGGARVFCLLLPWYKHLWVRARSQPCSNPLCLWIEGTRAILLCRYAGFLELGVLITRFGRSEQKSQSCSWIQQYKADIFTSLGLTPASLFSKFGAQLRGKRMVNSHPRLPT